MLTRWNVGDWIEDKESRRFLHRRLPGLVWNLLGLPAEPPGFELYFACADSASCKAGSGLIHTTDSP